MRQVGGNGLCVWVLVAGSIVSGNAGLVRPNDSGTLRGFGYPIKNACLPSREIVMPNARRTYRKGVHEGIDFYDGDVCAAVKRGTEVLAASDGVVSRADLYYRPMTARRLSELETKNPADGGVLDEYRGRQVWIDHIPSGGMFLGFPAKTLFSPVLATAVYLRSSRGVATGSVTGSGRTRRSQKRWLVYSSRSSSEIADGSSKKRFVEMRASARSSTIRRVEASCSDSTAIF